MAISVTVEVKPPDALTLLINNCKGIIEDSLDDIAGLTINKIAITAPRGVSGNLGQTGSWDYDVGKERWSRVVYPAATIAYAQYVSEGTGPQHVNPETRESQPRDRYTPPISALEPWAHKMGIPVGAIWSHIRKYGTKPNNYVEETLRLMNNVDIDRIVGYHIAQRGM